jgi:hypothetical protein
MVAAERETTVSTLVREAIDEMLRRLEGQKRS